MFPRTSIREVRESPRIFPRTSIILQAGGRGGMSETLQEENYLLLIILDCDVCSGG